LESLNGQLMLDRIISGKGGTVDAFRTGVFSGATAEALFACLREAGKDPTISMVRFVANRRSLGNANMAFADELAFANGQIDRCTDSGEEAHDRGGLCFVRPRRAV
jgi:hypothetical protein